MNGNCYKHTNEEAVSECEDCGKSLCGNCSRKYGDICICDECNLNRNTKSQVKIISFLIPSILLFIGGALLNIFVLKINMQGDILSKIIGALLMGYVFAGFPWGWRFLSKFWSTPKFPRYYGDGYRLVTGIDYLFWWIGIVLKFFAAVFVGLIALPLVLIEPIFKLIKAKKLEKAIKNSE